jgi:hypothetical protein
MYFAPGLSIRFRLVKSFYLRKKKNRLKYKLKIEDKSDD